MNGCTLVFWPSCASKHGIIVLTSRCIVRVSECLKTWSARHFIAKQSSSYLKYLYHFSSHFTRTVSVLASNSTLHQAHPNGWLFFSLFLCPLRQATGAGAFHGAKTSEGSRAEPRAQSIRMSHRIKFPTRGPCTTLATIAGRSALCRGCFWLFFIPCTKCNMSHTCR